jgi:glycosyltransferase involved in cell wall biosynthesis
VKLSIVTPSLNGRAYLARAADSILSQSGPFALEWIVVDGGSSDGSLDYLHSLRDDRLRLLAEPDRGQSHAINKGLALATGDVVAWLNTDDLYPPGALAAVAGALAQHPAARWLVGRCEIIDAAGRVIRRPVTRYKDRALARYGYRALLRENFISQPAVFWRRDFGRRTGELDESLHWTMDYDLWLRMARQSPPLRLERVLAQFRLHASSKTGRVDRRQFDEQYRVARRHAAGDRLSLVAHRLNVEKIVWAYRLMRLIGM